MRVSELSSVHVLSLLHERMCPDDDAIVGKPQTDEAEDVVWNRSCQRRRLLLYRMRCRFVTLGWSNLVPALASWLGLLDKLVFTVEYELDGGDKRCVACIGRVLMSPFSDKAC